MRFFAAPLLTLTCALSLGCSSSSSPTSQDSDAGSHATLVMSPTCGVVGARVVLRLDYTSDRRVPACLRADDFAVRFGSKLAAITKLGKTNEGFCSLDVTVPNGAESGTVSVSVDHDVFESTMPFTTPCP